jgi:hypothetical protein
MSNQANGRRAHHEAVGHKALQNNERWRSAALCIGLLAAVSAMPIAVTACAAGASQSDASSSAGPGAREAIYVSPSGDDNASGKTVRHAVASITTGIQRALGCDDQPCEVRIASGDYDEQVELVAGVDLIGGFNTTFDEQRAADHPVTITSSESRTMIADSLDAPVRLDGLTLTGADFGKRQDGKVSIALWVRASHDMLHLVNTQVHGGHGADGVAGEDGGALSCATTKSVGGEAFDCGGSKGASGDAGGDTVNGGEGGEPGSSNCPNACPLVGSDGISGGDTGAPGGDGADGTPAASSDDSHGQFSDEQWRGSRADAGTRGKNGTSGGGGGSGGSKRFKACFGCGTLLGGHGGDGGRGGCGGGGGEAGGVGGASFAIVLIDSSIAIEGGTVIGGTGGDGGRGGDGAAGEDGGSDGSENQSEKNSQKCGLINYHSGAGASGAAGGKGGRGGAAAGGNGGPSIGIALVAGSAVAPAYSFDASSGKAGSPGNGGFGSSDATPGIEGAVEKIYTY